MSLAIQLSIVVVATMYFVFMMLSAYRYLALHHIRDALTDIMEAIAGGIAILLIAQNYLEWQFQTELVWTIHTVQWMTIAFVVLLSDPSSHSHFMRLGRLLLFNLLCMLLVIFIL